MQLLLFSIRCISKTETTVELSWPVSSSVVKLLGFFPRQADEESKNDMWTIHCRSMFRAAIVLSQQYNITFQGQFLTYEEIITDDDIMVTVDQTCQKVLASNIVGFIGPAYSSEARYLASFAYRLGILSVSYSATSPDLSTIDNGAFYRVVPSDENTALSLTILFKQYKWKSCIIIYENDEYGYNGMKLLSQEFSAMNIKTLEKIKFDIKQQNFEIDFKKTLLDSSSRIVIVWANEKSAITILEKAIEENLIGPYFVWILTTTIALDYFNQRQKKELIGILTIEPVKGDFVDVSINATLLNQAYQIWKDYELDTFPGENNVSSYGLFTFDATWSLILSLQQLCSMQSLCLEFTNVSNCYNRQFFNSKQYYNIMRTMKFLGVSGQVTFSNETTDRVADVYYIIKNIQPLNIEQKNIDYLPVLKWHIGSTNWTYYKDKSDDIIWPNLSKNIPVDHKLIQGQELRMAIIHSPPFIILKNSTSTYSDMTDNYKIIDITEFDGLFKDIMLYLKDRMSFRPVIIIAKPTIQYNELVDGVANRLFDTVMTTIAINAKRSKIVDFSAAIFPRSYRIVTRKPKSSQLNFLFFLKPFSWTLWLLILGTVFYASILIWFFQPKNADTQGNDKEYLTIEQSISYTICIILGKGPFFNVSTRAGRFLTYGLHALQIILLAIYTASLLASIIIENFKPTISGIDDIRNGKILPNRIGILVGSQAEEYYLNSISQDKKDYYPLKTANEVYTSLIDGDIDVAIWSNGSTEYHVNNIYCDLMTVGVEFAHGSYQIPVRQDWVYKTDLDFNILSLIESEELDRISAKWFGQRTCSKTNLFEPKIITVQIMGGLFITFLIISIISILIHFWSGT
ncbi:unnamed protein product, partial [Rotaria sp. Silwood2]